MRFLQFRSERERRLGKQGLWEMKRNRGEERTEERKRGEKRKGKQRGGQEGKKEKEQRIGGMRRAQENERKRGK